MTETTKPNPAHDVAGRHERRVSLVCKCGDAFERPQRFIENAKKYATEYPGAARFFKRKITLCDKCNAEFIHEAIKRLPEVLKTLTS